MYDKKTDVILVCLRPWECSQTDRHTDSQTHI